MDSIVDLLHEAVKHLSDLHNFRRSCEKSRSDIAAHFSFPKDMWSQLKEQDRITYHPVFPDSPGPAARSIEDDADVRDVIELLRLNYDRFVARFGLPAQV